MNLTNYRPDIDGLRALAVLAVVFHHLSASLVPGGYVGVDVFFVISGYLITKIISREIADGEFTFSKFYERRAKRIFPALFAVLGTTVLVGYFLLLPKDYDAVLRATLGTLFFSSNIFFWHELQDGYFAQNAKLNPLLHTWSLAVEEQFYLFFPFALLVCHKFFRRKIFWMLSGFALLSLCASAFFIDGKSVAVFFLLPFRAWELLAGALLTFSSSRTIRSRLLREICVAGGLIAIIGACFLYDVDTAFPGVSALLPVLGAVAIIHAGASGKTLAGRLLQLRPVVYIGLISYSLYLWHWPLIVLTKFATGMAPLTPYITWLFAVSLLLGSISYHFIEQPFRRGLVISTRRTVFSLSAVITVLLAAVAVVGLFQNGYAGRFDPGVVKLDNARISTPANKTCDDRKLGRWCKLGQAEGDAEFFLWGDSHMLAWGPAFQEVLNKHHQSAIFAPSSNCPPIFGVEHKGKSACGPNNSAIKKFLLANPEIKTIVMAADWKLYFRENSPLSASSPSTTSTNGSSAAEVEFFSTIQWLRANGRQAILIGPVPTYDKDVPLAHALELTFGRSVLHRTSASEQRYKNALFFSALNSIPPGPNFRFLDPIQWLCAEDCLMMKDGESLYRDSGHLSIAGAMAMEESLSKGLGFGRHGAERILGSALKD